MFENTMFDTIIKISVWKYSVWYDYKKQFLKIQCLIRLQKQFLKIQCFIKLQKAMFDTIIKTMFENAMFYTVTTNNFCKYNIWYNYKKTMFENTMLDTIIKKTMFDTI